MRERMPTVLLALGALLLFYLLFIPKPHRTEVPEGLPLSSDARPDGYLAIWRWLGAQHIPRLSLRYRYARLPALLRHPTGNLLLMTLPQRVPMHRAELTALKRWIGRGNTVLIIAALDDTPLWSLGTGRTLEIEDLRRLTGLQFTPMPAAPLLRELRERPLNFVSAGAQPLLADVSDLRAIGSLPARQWLERPLPGAPLPLTLARRPDGGKPTLWLQSSGAGQIILCAAASPFSNAGILLADNARFLANVVDWSVRRGGTVVFDDAHEGLAAFYDARAFYADPRLHATLAWIALMWLVFVLGSRPLRNQSRAWRPASEVTDLEGSARYLAAVVRPAAVARRLIEDFLAELRTAAQPDPWLRLAHEPRVTPQQLRALRALYQRACADERVNLTRLQTLLAWLRRQMT